MQMMDYLYGGCATLIIFIILLVGTKRLKLLSDYIFLCWMVVLLLNVATFIVINRFGYPASVSLRILVEFSEASVFLHGPVFLAYTMSLTSPAVKFDLRKAIHLVPFLVCLAVLISAIKNKDGADNTTRQALTILKMCSLFLYTSAVIIHLRQHRRRVDRIFSNTESKYLGWLGFLAWGIISIWLIFCVGLLMYNYSIIRLPAYGSAAGNLAFCAFIFLVGYFGVRQEAVFSFLTKQNSNSYSDEINTDIVLNAAVDIELEETLTQQDENISSPSAAKYKHSGLSKERSSERFESFARFMQEKKPYRDSELTLFTLSKQFNIHPNHLSQLINQNRKQNFFDYINELRVNDVKEVLLSGKYANHSLLGIAHEFGFNSKASFNRAFKKFTGITPSEYKRECKR
jgi:AraC-like DNA-binding protein